MGDLSREDGGRMRPHASHRNGRDTFPPARAMLCHAGGTGLEPWSLPSIAAENTGLRAAPTLQVVPRCGLGRGERQEEMTMKWILGSGGALLVAAGCSLWLPSPVAACGGFFCGQQPVDQQAERVVFAINADGTTTMVVQIQYQGEATDFAWVVPVGGVPDADSLATFPQAALLALDANTGPQFQFPDDPECYSAWELDAAAGPPRAGGGVDVHLREQVGPYDVAVIESRDPTALTTWLRDNGFRVTSAMEPYIALYAAEGMKLLALRLQPGREVSEIEPFQLTLPGTSPTIPLRLTALAAEPEMGIAVFILGDMRYGPGGDWVDVSIDETQVVWRPYTWPTETNWAAVVARTVDGVGGKGFVTEFAGETAPYLELIRNTTPADEEQERAQAALLGLLEGRPYLTRLYTRLSPEEMRSDPTFKRVGGPDVDRLRMLARFVEGRDLCEADMSVPSMRDSTTPCDFATCGAGGLCRVVDQDDTQVAGCACVPGTTARTTFDPSGRPVVSCIDMRLSFLNPGDRELPGEAPLPDPCVGFACGVGTCVAMNMTPTCVCERGLVAVGSFADGVRQTRCVSPTDAVPADFYAGRLPELPRELPGGRIVDTPPAPELGGGGGCSITSSSSGMGSSGMGSLAVGALVFAVFGLLGGRRRRR
jgi:MYXO-CTERM domain-containing protein